MATKVDPESAMQIKKAVNMTSLFQARLAETPKKPMPPAEKGEQNSHEKEEIC
ncbi:MAG: hypothetical protein WCF19_08025 [Chlamydiales bacterium]